VYLELVEKHWNHENKWPCFEPKESRWVYLEIDFECEGFEIQEASTFI
jgi:hypothetical protein